MLTKPERARIGGKIDEVKSINQVQIWWRGIEGRSAKKLVQKTFRHCHRKLIDEDWWVIQDDQDARKLRSAENVHVPMCSKNHVSQASYFCSGVL